MDNAGTTWEGLSLWNDRGVISDLGQLPSFSDQPARVQPMALRKQPLTVYVCQEMAALYQFLKNVS